MKSSQLCRWLLTGSVLFLLAAEGMAAYLESDYQEPGPFQVPPPRWEPRPWPPEPPFPPPPRVDWGVAGFVRSLSVGSPAAYGHLTVFPLYHPAGRRDRGYVDMDEALRRGDLEIRERGGGVVSEVIVTNHSGSFVLLLAGEILVGGKQNRILRRDVLLAPYSREVVIPAYCVERGRWTPSSEGRFRGLGYMSGSGLRRSALESSSQDRVWDEVAELSERHSYSSPTQDLGGLYEQGEVEQRIGTYRRGLRAVLRDDPVGVVVCCRGRLVSVDFFVDSHLFEASWPKILSSHVVELDVPLRRHRPWPPVPDRGEVERFLRRIDRCTFSREWGPGAGTTVRVSGPGMWGSALVHHSEPVHGTLFADR